MSGATGQAAGMAIGAAVGSLVGQPLAGAAIGAGGAGYLQSRGDSSTQYKLDTEALRLNKEQARLKAAETSAIHASNFRQALASQIASAAMRGGSGSLVTQFGSEAFKNFNQDERAIATGLKISEAQNTIEGAGATARKAARDTQSAMNFASTAFSGVNLNLLKPRADNG